MNGKKGGDPRLEAIEIMVEQLRRETALKEPASINLGGPLSQQMVVAQYPERVSDPSPVIGVASLLELLSKELWDAHQMSLNLADCATEIAGNGEPTLNSPPKADQEPFTVTEKLAHSIDLLRMVNSRNREALNRLNATLGR